jgi:diacylglycerol O-acyltransferase
MRAAGEVPGARRLSAADRSILALENETVAGHTGKVIRLAGPLDLDELRASVAARLPRAPGWR